MGARLPKEYQEVEWIESHGTEYINTGVIGKTGMEVIADLQLTNTSNSYLFGYGGGSNNRFALSYYSNFTFDYNTKELHTSITSGTERHKVSIKDYTVTVDGIETTGSAENYTTPYPLFIFARSVDNGTASTYARMRLFSLQIKGSTDLIRDYVPCYRKSDGEAGLYCTVTNEFYPNLGTGAFTVGLDVNPILRTFQNGVVGNTNIIEGMVILDNPYEQLVNYTMLYDSGDECNAVSGGWVSGRYIDAYGNSVGTMDKNSNNLRCVAGGSSSLVSSGFFTQNKIDLSSYNKIFYNISEMYEGFAVTTCANPNVREDTRTTTLPRIDFGNAADDEYPLGTGLFAMDVANFSEPMYVGFGCWAYGSIIAVEGVLAVKTDNWQVLCSKVGVSTSSLDALLGDSNSLNIILNNKDAVNFMVAQCTGEFMFSAIQSSTFLTALNNSTYKTKIQSNEHWAKALSMVV